jgi:hypothetical protein
MRPQHKVPRKTHRLACFYGDIGTRPPPQQQIVLVNVAQVLALQPRLWET